MNYREAVCWTDSEMRLVAHCNCNAESRSQLRWCLGLVTRCKISQTFSNSCCLLRRAASRFAQCTSQNSGRSILPKSSLVELSTLSLCFARSDSIFLANVRSSDVFEAQTSCTIRITLYSFQEVAVAHEFSIPFGRCASVPRLNGTRCTDPMVRPCAGRITSQTRTLCCKALAFIPTISPRNQPYSI